MSRVKGLDKRDNFAAVFRVPMEKAADYVRRARKQLGLKKTELAAKLSRDRKTVTRWESGENQPCYADIQKIEALLLKAPKP